MEKAEEKSLREYTGLPIKLTEQGIEGEGSNVSIKKEIEVKVKELKNVLMEEEIENEEEVVYKIYKDVKLVEHKETWGNVRFDLIVMWPKKLGEEYSKIKGYYRSIADNGFRYPEIFQVAEGYAEFILQQPGDKHEKVKKAIIVRAQRMEVVIIPPAFGVTIINPTTEKTVIARIRARDAEEVSKEYEKTKGECYYRIEKEKWIPNNNYEELPLLEIQLPQNKWKIMKRGIPIYEAQLYNPKTTETLIYPDPSEFIL